MRLGVYTAWCRPPTSGIPPQRDPPPPTPRAARPGHPSRAQGAFARRVVREVPGQDVAQVPFTEHQHMVQTLPPDGADEALDERVLPRTPRSRQHFRNPQALQAVAERLAVDGIAIAEYIRRRGLVRERLHDLLRRPRRRRVLGDVELQDASTMMGEDEQDEE